MQKLQYQQCHPSPAAMLNHQSGYSIRKDVFYQLIDVTKNRLCIDEWFFAGATKATTGRLQRVLNAAVRVVSNTRKFDPGLHNLMHIDLHWLDVPERVTYKHSVH